MRVKEILDTFHYSERLLAPLIRDKRSHVPSRSVFGLKGTVIFPDNHFSHIADHRLVAVHFRLGVKRLVDDEMEVPFKGVTVDAGVIVAVPVQQRGQIDRRVRQVFDVECDVLDEAGSPLPAHPADGREYSRTDGPILSGDGRVAAEYERFTLRIIQDTKPVKHIGEFPGIGLQIRLVSPRDAEQKSGQVLVGIFLDHRIFDRRKRPFVKQFGGIEHRRVNLFPQGHNRFGGLADRTEIDHRGRLL